MLNFSKKDRQDDFLNLMHEHQRIVAKVCRIYTNSKDDSEDLYQEIFIQAWQSFVRFKGDSKFSTWLYKVSLNTALTRKRKNNVLHQSVQWEDTENKSPAIENNYEFNDLLDKALSLLNDTDKAFILLSIEGYSYEEIANMMGVTVNHTGVKISRIKAKLKHLLKNN